VRFEQAEIQTQNVPIVAALPYSN